MSTEIMRLKIDRNTIQSVSWLSLLWGDKINVLGRAENNTQTDEE